MGRAFERKILGNLSESAGLGKPLKPGHSGPPASRVWGLPSSLGQGQPQTTPGMDYTSFQEKESDWLFFGLASTLS